MMFKRDDTDANSRYVAAAFTCNCFTSVLRVPPGIHLRAALAFNISSTLIMTIRTEELNLLILSYTTSVHHICTSQWVS